MPKAFSTCLSDNSCLSRLVSGLSDNSPSPATSLPSTPVHASSGAVTAATLDVQNPATRGQEHGTETGTGVKLEALTASAGRPADAMAQAGGVAVVHDRFTRYSFLSP